MVAVQEAPGRSLELSTAGSKWLVQGTFTARMQVETGSVALTFDPGRLFLRQGVPVTVKRHIVSITPCLASTTNDPTSPFTISRRGPTHVIERDVMAEQDCSVSAWNASIALDGTVNLPDHWVVLQIELASPAPDDARGSTFVYIASARNIFTATP